MNLKNKEKILIALEEEDYVLEFFPPEGFVEFVRDKEKESFFVIYNPKVGLFNKLFNQPPKTYGSCTLKILGCTFHCDYWDGKIKGDKVILKDKEIKDSITFIMRGGERRISISKQIETFELSNKCLIDEYYETTKKGYK